MVKSMNQINLEVLEVLIGTEKYQEVMRVMKGATLYFGKDIETRNQEIRQAFYDGIDRKILAEQYGLSLQSIYKITESKP